MGEMEFLLIDLENIGWSKFVEGESGIHLEHANHYIQLEMYDNYQHMGDN